MEVTGTRYQPPFDEAQDMLPGRERGSTVVGITGIVMISG
jgi:hypothetical protein